VDIPFPVAGEFESRHCHALEGSPV
jgi:hypothetical protein